jgi:hypothetical protein
MGNWLKPQYVIPLVKVSKKLHWTRKRRDLRILAWANQVGALIHSSYLSRL